MREFERSDSPTPRGSSILPSLLFLNSFVSLPSFFNPSLGRGVCNGCVYLYGFLEAFVDLFGRFNIIPDLHVIWVRETDRRTRVDLPWKRCCPLNCLNGPFSCCFIWRSRDVAFHRSLSVKVVSYFDKDTATSRSSTTTQYPRRFVDITLGATDPAPYRPVPKSDLLGYPRALPDKSAAEGTSPVALSTSPGHLATGNARSSLPGARREAVLTCYRFVSNGSDF